MSGRVLRIGTRGSRLALWQAHAVAARLTAAGQAPAIVVIKTSGDRSQMLAPSQATPNDVHKREFVKELEDALLAGEIDVAVHSAKDLPVDLPAGLDLAACLPREDPLDGIVLPRREDTFALAEVVAFLRERAVIGTGSVRRIAQLAVHLSGARFAPVRGNVDTRLGKLDAGGFDALVLACAGLRRLGFARRISVALPIDVCVPAPGQGIVATEIRAGDDEARATLMGMHDAAAGQALTAERALVTALGGGCQLPLGAIALHEDGRLVMHAVVASRDGMTSLRRTRTGSPSAPADLGRALADELAAEGARDLLDQTGL